MKKILLIGDVGCGKTTLSQRLNGYEIKYEKTQTLTVTNKTIDTPGEYLENRMMLRNLTAVAGETDYVVFMQSAVSEQFLYSPGQSAAFSVPVIGIVSKADIATEKQLELAKEMLEIAGADPIFTISAVSGSGVDEFAGFLNEQNISER